MQPYRKFLKQLSLFFILGMIPFLFNLAFAIRAGENMPLSEVAKRLQHTDELYFSSYNNNTYGFKMGLVKAVKPELILLGSSRLLNTKENFFTTSMVNMGLAMNGLEEGRKAVQEIVDFYTPKLIVLSLDYWWFHEDAIGRERFAPHSIVGNEISFDKFTLPFSMLYKGNISWSIYYRVLFTDDRHNDLTTYQSLGAASLAVSNGYLKDGSFLTIRPNVYNPPGFISDLEKIKTRRELKQTGKTISSDRWTIFLDILKICEEKNIKVIILNFPLAEPVFQAFEQGEGHAYFKDLRARIKELGLEYYEFDDPKLCGAQECEFLDGFHPGDIASMRVYREMIRQNPESALRPYLDLDFLETSINKYAGVTVWPGNPSRLKQKEIDFLGIGCSKQID